MAVPRIPGLLRAVPSPHATPAVPAGLLSRLFGYFIRPNATKNLTAGYTATSLDLGTKSSGTVTPDPAARNFQHYTNNGAHTLAPPSATCTIVLDIVNAAAAGIITTSGFSWVTGSSLTTTSGHKFRCFISVGNNGSHLHVQAMQ